MLKNKKNMQYCVLCYEQSISANPRSIVEHAHDQFNVYAAVGTAGVHPEPLLDIALAQLSQSEPVHMRLKQILRAVRSDEYRNRLLNSIGVCRDASDVDAFVAVVVCSSSLSLLASWRGYRASVCAPTKARFPLPVLTGGNRV